MKKDEPSITIPAKFQFTDLKCDNDHVLKYSNVRSEMLCDECNLEIPAKLMHFKCQTQKTCQNYHVDCIRKLKLNLINTDKKTKSKLT